MLLRRCIAAAALALISVRTVAVENAAVPQHEIWIAVRTDGRGGAGTRKDPYDGSVAEKLDALLDAILPGTAVHFGSGTFETRGVKIKDRCAYIGSGKNRTVLRLAPAVLTSETPPEAAVLYNVDTEGYLEFAAVSDMTIDCNRAAQPLFRSGGRGILNALCVAARSARIARVRALGTWSNAHEGFPFSVRSTGGSDGSSRVEIEGCENLNSAGRVTAISVFDQTGGRVCGGIRNCLVTDNPLAVGFGAGGWRNFIVANNRTRDVESAVVIDTHDYENVVMERNRFRALRYGILFNGYGKYDNIVIRHNYFELAAGAEACLWTSKTPVMTTIRDNVFVQNSLAAPVFFLGENTTGLIANNVVREHTRSQFRGPPALNILNNRDRSGRVIRFPRSLTE